MIPNEPGSPEYCGDFCQAQPQDEAARAEAADVEGIEPCGCGHGDCGAMRDAGSGAQAAA